MNKTELASEKNLQLLHHPLILCLRIASAYISLLAAETTIQKLIWWKVTANLTVCIAGSRTSWTAERPSSPATHLGKVELQGDLQLLRIAPWCSATKEHNEPIEYQSAKHTIKSCLWIQDEFVSATCVNCPYAPKLEATKRGKSSMQVYRCN